MRIVGQASTGREVAAVAYLMSYDPDFTPPAPEPLYPSGLAMWTTDPELAMRFDHPSDGWLLWQTQSSTVPYRPDGGLNKPLTAWSVEIVPW